MKGTTASALLAALTATTTTFKAVNAVPVVDETYPYKGPAIPIGDWVDPTVNGNGKGFPRLVEAPAVRPKVDNPTNNVNVISLSYLPQGINIHYQTPFGLGELPKVKWGTNPKHLEQETTGYSHTYDRTPPCSLVTAITQCSQFFHEVQLRDLLPSTTYYYQIVPANGTTESDVLSFTTSRPAGTPGEFSFAVLNDMGYTNAWGTYKQLQNLVDEGAVFTWHGGDLSYADDWYDGILPCEDDWPVCYNGSNTELPGPVPEWYKQPLPEGEIANQGGPQGGDMSVIYESNWDLWQQWILNVTSKVPYMTLPGNHDISCGEYDGPGNPLTAYLNNNQSNSTAPETELTYYSCPPSQRNFTTYQHRFWNPGNETGGVGNFWYSFDYGLAHFIALDAETDYAYSPEWPFARDLTGNETFPQENETFITDSGPFGYIDGSIYDNEAYEQYQWLKSDLEKVDRSKTPWVIVMSHRPMYSSAYSSYMANVQDAWQDLLLKYGVDVYIGAHIHWYERLYPLTVNGTVDNSSVVDANTYYTNPGKTLTHLTNGMAGNVESHSTLSDGETQEAITAYLDQVNYGLTKFTIYNETALLWQFVHGLDGSIGDHLWLLKKESDKTPPPDTCED